MKRKHIIKNTIELTRLCLKDDDNFKSASDFLLNLLISASSSTGGIYLNNSYENIYTLQTSKNISISGFVITITTDDCAVGRCILSNCAHVSEPPLLNIDIPIDFKLVLCIPVLKSVKDVVGRSGVSGIFCLFDSPNNYDKFAKKVRPLIDIYSSFIDSRRQNKTDLASPESSIDRQILNCINYEVRSPLNFILATNNKLKSTLSLEMKTATDKVLVEQKKEDVENIRQSSLTILSIVNDLNDMLKPALKLVEKDFDYIAMIKNAVEISEANYPTTPKITLKIDENITKYKFITDCERLKQLYINYFNSAIKYVYDKNMHGQIDLQISMSHLDENTQQTQISTRLRIEDVHISNDDLLNIEKSQYGHVEGAHNLPFVGISMLLNHKIMTAMGGFMGMSCDTFGLNLLFILNIKAYETKSIIPSLNIPIMTNSNHNLRRALIVAKYDKIDYAEINKECLKCNIFPILCGGVDEIENYIENGDFGIVVYFLKDDLRKIVDELKSIRALIKRNKPKSRNSIVMEGGLNIKNMFSLSATVNKEIGENIPIVVLTTLKTNIMLSREEKLALNDMINYGVASKYPDVVYAEINKYQRSFHTVREIIDSVVFTNEAKVIVADDNEINQNELFKILRKRGFNSRNILIAENGTEALELFGNVLKEPPVPILIFLDMLMPIMSGYDAAREINKIIVKNGYKHVFIIGMVSMPTNEEMARYQNSDYFRELLIKPITEEKINAIV